MAESWKDQSRVLNGGGDATWESKVFGDENMN